MTNFLVDQNVNDAIIFAEMIAKAHVAESGDPIDLFATFVSMIVQEDKALGMNCLSAVDEWFSAGRESAQTRSPRPKAIETEFGSLRRGARKPRY